MLKRFIFILFFINFSSISFALEKCKWNNQKGVPCVTITKTPNTSLYNSLGVNKKIFTRQQIIS